jgi:hypothetical protein
MPFSVASEASRSLKALCRRMVGSKEVEATPHQISGHWPTWCWQWSFMSHVAPTSPMDDKLPLLLGRRLWARHTGLGGTMSVYHEATRDRVDL